MMATLIAIGVFAQNDFPYGKLLNYSSSDFSNAKFKYNAKKSTWTLIKVDGADMLNQLSTLMDNPNAEIKVSENNYTIVVQMGANQQIATIEVNFFKKSVYNDIVEFANKNGTNLKVTDLDVVQKTTFDYGQYHFRLLKTQVGTSEGEKCYEYNYQIDTGLNAVGTKASSVDAFY